MKLERLLTKNRFTAWLKSQSPNRRFTHPSTEDIVLKYLSDNGKNEPYIDPRECSYIGSNNFQYIRDTPKWLSQFIQDNTKCRSPKQCLEILASI